MSQLTTKAVRNGPDHLDHILQLNDCTDAAQVSEVLRGLSASLGFEYFQYRGQFSADGVRHTQQAISNYPAVWQARYDSQGFAECDPTFLHAATSLRPLAWHDAMFANPPQQAMRAEARQYGIVSGITFPIQSKKGEVGLLNFALRRQGATVDRMIKESLPFGAFAATLVHETMGDITRRSYAKPLPKLTEREVDVLKWVAAGKTSWEISRLLNISSHGVVFHVRNILHKFDVTSRHQAVMRAMSFGLL
jgi:LuxR family quorum-sensing transcriptional regulator LasR